MKIVVKTNLISNIQEVINIFYAENQKYMEEWIHNYLNNCKVDEIENEIESEIENDGTIFYLIKKQKVLSNGYLYNTSKILSEKMYSVKILDFECNLPCNIDNVPTSTNVLWNGINNEINHKIMRQIDHESLYQLNIKFDNALKTKNTWNTTEIIMLQNEITRCHEKQLYSSIVKKIKKFNKKINMKKSKNNTITLTTKTISIDESGNTIGDGHMPDLSKFSLDPGYQIINKEKYD